MSREEKMKRQILVVKAETLFQEKKFEGFLAATEYDFEKIILNSFEYQIRWDMEINPDFQQPIPYAIVVNPTTKKIIAYQRGNNSWVSWEQRLYNKRSLWIGWHIELEEKDAHNPLQATLIKEVQEEIWLDSIDSFEVIGYLNDNSDEVGKVHFGVLYVLYTHDSDVQIGDGELEQVFFKTKDEIDNIMNDANCDVESWSRIAREAYKQL